MTEWLAELDSGRRRHAQDLIELLLSAGFTDAADRVRSEIREDIPQTARALFLRSVWPRFIDAYSAGCIDPWIRASEAEPNGAFADAGQALKRLRAEGSPDSDIEAVARAVAYEVVFGLLYHVGYGENDDFEDGPGWRLMEVDRESDAVTGRVIGFLFEDLLGMDPSGREGRPPR
jgi:hypothetical protein